MEVSGVTYNDYATLKYSACEPITGNPCVDTAVCADEDYCYEDEFGLFNHGLYLAAVADATKACGITGQERGNVVSAAAKSNVNKPGYCANA